MAVHRLTLGAAVIFVRGYVVSQVTLFSCLRIPDWSWIKLPFNTLSKRSFYPIRSVYVNVHPHTEKTSKSLTPCITQLLQQCYVTNIQTPCNDKHYCHNRLGSAGCLRFRLWVSWTVDWIQVCSSRSSSDLAEAPFSADHQSGRAKLNCISSVKAFVLLIYANILLGKASDMANLNIKKARKYSLPTIERGEKWILTEIES